MYKYVESQVVSILHHINNNPRNNQSYQIHSTYTRNNPIQYTTNQSNMFSTLNSSVLEPTHPELFRDQCNILRTRLEALAQAMNPQTQNPPADVSPLVSRAQETLDNVISRGRRLNSFGTDEELHRAVSDVFFRREVSQEELNRAISTIYFRREVSHEGRDYPSWFEWSIVHTQKVLEDVRGDIQARRSLANRFSTLSGLAMIWNLGEQDPNWTPYGVITGFHRAPKLEFR